MIKLLFQFKEWIDADHPAATGAKGVIGMGATSAGWGLSVLPEIEAWLRIVSLLMGIAVGGLTLASLIHAGFCRARKNSQKETETTKREQTETTTQQAE